MEQTFAQDDPSIPPLLRHRIENWINKPPKTQFSQYGPLNAYLSIKFPPDRFIVKPQALLRELWDTTNLEVEDIDAWRAIILGEVDHNMEVDDNIQKDIRRRVSIDSHGALVDVNKSHYPDFVVTAYGPGGLHDEPEDIIRLVVEVGSLGRNLTPPSEKDKAEVIKQLHRYLFVMGKMGFRWGRDAVGLCIIGTEVIILKSRANGEFQKTGTWCSLYSENFTKTIRELANR